MLAKGIIRFPLVTIGARKSVRTHSYPLPHLIALSDLAGDGQEGQARWRATAHRAYSPTLVQDHAQREWAYHRYERFDLRGKALRFFVGLSGMQCRRTGIIYFSFRPEAT